MDLKQLMDPEFQMAQARYENYRVAVDKAYKMAESTAEYNDYKFHSKTAEGSNLYTIEDLTSEKRVAGIVSVARMLIPAIYEDMENAIKLLDEKEETNAKRSLSPSSIDKKTLQ